MQHSISCMCGQCGYAAQRSASPLLQRYSDCCAQQNDPYQGLYERNAVFRHLMDKGRRRMTASDLGIVDQLLDDKVGMEP